MLHFYRPLATEPAAAAKVITARTGNKRLEPMQWLDESERSLLVQWVHSCSKSALNLQRPS